ncbi:MAG: hypothetical protein ACI97A_003901, partial [Planctomycetota bacterium]
MSKRISLFAFLLLLVSLILAGGYAFATQDEVEQADKDFKEHSYRPALKGYQEILADPKRSEDARGHAARRIGLCLERLKKWDDALKHLDTTYAQFAGSIWRPRIRALEGAIRVRMPHYYYKKGDVISRQQWIQGATYNYTYYDDVLSGMKALGEARKLYEPFLPKWSPGMTSISDDERKVRADEYSRLCFNMAAALEAHRQQKGGLNGIEPAESVKADLEKHNIGFGFGRDPQVWFKAAQTLCQRYALKDRQALAHYMEAMYCRRLLDSQETPTIKFEDGQYVTRCRVGGTDEEPILIKMPADKDPFLLFKSLIKSFPESPVTDDSIYVLATMQSRYGLHVEALKMVAGFSERFPKSRWRSDVLNLVQEITHPRLNAASVQAFQPGEKIELELESRNIKTLDVTAYEVDLGEIMATRSFVKDSKSRFANLAKLIGAGGSKYLSRRRPAFTGTYSTGDEGKHFSREGKTTLQLPKVGAYLVELSADESTFQTLVVVSNIAIIRKTTDEETVVYVGGAEDGKPITEAKVLVRQRHRAKGLLGWYDKMNYDWKESNAEGVAVRVHASSSGKQINIEAFAQKGEHYALTLEKSTYPKRSGNKTITLYGFTDRPVYRPAQTIQFVGNMRQRIDEDYKNMESEYFDVQISDPKGNKLFTQVLQADDFGVVSGSLTVGEEPPLGVYRVAYRHKGSWVGSHNFRIEEYKKPEFEVTVDGPDKAIRVGDKFNAKVHGEFYFGGGVADAKVSWRIFRERYYPTFNFSEPYSYLYGKRSSKRRPSRRGNRELVAQGNGTTDSAGDLLLEIDSAPWKTKYADQDHRFVIEADLTDLSRRTISGSGQILAPRRGLFAHVKANRGFYRTGEKASFEIRLQKPDGSPSESTGQVIVYQVTATRDGEEINESRRQVAVSAAKTDKKGMGKFDWQTDSPGRFVIRYVTQDRWGEPVVGEQYTWITSPDYKADDFQLNNVEIVSDRTEYRPGDEAFLMINCQFPGSYVMVAIEAERSVLSYQIVKMIGKTAVMTLPIEKNFAPNVFMTATMIHSGRFYVSSQELFVPPTHKLMNVGLSFDKDSYLPGEMATLQVDSRNENGDGIPAQFALRVMDKAITYIAQDDTPDIRKFYYGRRRTYSGGNRWNNITSNSGQFRFSGHLARNRDWKNYRRHGMPSGYNLDLGLAGRVFDERQRSGKKGNWGAAQGLLKEELPQESGEPEAEESSLLLDSDDSFATADKKSDAGRPSVSRAMAPQSKMRQSRKDLKSKKPQGDFENSVGADEPEIRENFSDLAHWHAKLRTGADGKASLKFKFPDSLTTWVATLRGLTKDTKVGVAETEIKTTKNILVRLQAPRFFTERDEIVVSGIVRNDFAEAVKAKVSLTLIGDTLVVDAGLEREVEIAAKSEIRIDWLVKVKKAGEARIMLKALCARESDAMRMTFPVLTYGIDKVVTKTKVLHGGDGVANFPIDIPEDRRVGTTAMELTLAPSLATSLLEALPYLVEYPYGCTEQTMSRFLPAVIVARTLKDMGISLDEIAARRVDLENKGQLNARNLVPVYTKYELDSVVKAGLRRLTSMQNSDGGFGWWKSDTSSMHLTAYVLHGLAEAKNAGYSISDTMIKRAAS